MSDHCRPSRNALEEVHSGSPPSAVHAGLTAREHDVVIGLAKGRAPKQIAADGGVSTATIRAHIQNAKRKTRARTLTELVAILVRAGGPVSS